MTSRDTDKRTRTHKRHRAAPRPRVEWKMEAAVKIFFLDEVELVVDVFLILANLEQPLEVCGWPAMLN